MVKLERLTANPRVPLAIATLSNTFAYFITSKYVSERSGVSGVATLGVVMAIANVLIAEHARLPQSER